MAKHKSRLTRFALNLPPVQPIGGTAAAPAPETPGGKRSDPAYQQISLYVRRDTYRQVKRRLLDNEDTLQTVTISDLVGQLLAEWLEREGA